MARPLFILYCLLLAAKATGQVNKPIQSRQAYLLSVKGKPAKQMVDLQTFIPGIRLDVRYATTNNCTHTQLYATPNVYLRRSAATALKAAQAELEEYQMGLIVYDAYRPLSVTAKIWNAVQDPRYAARPTNGSAHNKGLAVDVSIYSQEMDRVADMGTDFDSFSDSAATDFQHVSKSAWLNRQWLRAIMVKHGFKPLSTEWWHFSYPDKDGCEVLDVPFEDLN